MKFKVATACLLSSLALGLPLASFAQHPDDHHDGGSHYVRHDEWKKGARIQQNDWNRGTKIDYRSHHLNAPPRGYEWREVDGNYVMAAVATGIIATAIAASGH